MLEFANKNIKPHFLIKNYFPVKKIPIAIYKKSYINSEISCTESSLLNYFDNFWLLLLIHLQG